MNQKLIFSIVLLVLLLVMAKIWVANLWSTTGEKISSYQKEKMFLVGENQQLEEEIAKISSLSSLSGQAEKANFGKPQEIVFLSPQTFFAWR